MKRADWLLVISILSLALIFTAFNKQTFFNSPDVGLRTKAIIKVQGEKVKDIPLSGEKRTYTFEVQGKVGTAIIEVKENSIRMYESPCDEQICVQRGWISSPGESIICVPSEIVVEIESEKKPYDAVTY